MNLRAVLRLCRIPNVFTAFANVVAGVLLARQGQFHAADLLLVAASGCLYLAGMVLNDFFDRRVDALERPDRPIPAGQVAPLTAASLGLALLAIGVVLAAVAGVRSLVVALLLVTAILLYDVRLKGTGWGPFGMGACRFLNVALGLCAGSFPGQWTWTAPVVMGTYTGVITYLARDEVGGSSRLRAQTAVSLMVLLGLGTAVVLLDKMWGHWAHVALTLPFAGLVALQGSRLFRPLWREATGPTIGRAIGGGILLMPAIDATMVAAAGYPLGALAVAALAGPAYVLRRWYYLT
jgi:4-hydroxybenzoate polyprenyltransferase